MHSFVIANKGIKLLDTCKKEQNINIIVGLGLLYLDFPLATDENCCLENRGTLATHTKKFHCTCSFSVINLIDKDKHDVNNYFKVK